MDRPRAHAAVAYLPMARSASKLEQQIASAKHYESSGLRLVTEDKVPAGLLCAGANAGMERPCTQTDAFDSG